MMTHDDGRLEMRQVEGPGKFRRRHADHLFRTVEAAALDISIAMIDDRATPTQFRCKTHHGFGIRSRAEHQQSRRRIYPGHKDADLVVAQVDALVRRTLDILQ